MQNHVEISSKSEFWTRDVPNWSKCLYGKLTESWRFFQDLSRRTHKGPYGPIWAPTRTGPTLGNARSHLDPKRITFEENTTPLKMIISRLCFLALRRSGMSRRLRDLQNSVLILSNGAVWTRNASLLKTNIRAHMGPYGPQPGPGPNPDWAPTRARAYVETYERWG